MKTLHLTLRKKFFDMIASGEKPEEYREIKPYWIKRLVEDADYPKNKGNYDFIDGYGQEYLVTKYRHFDIVSANNGYQKSCPNIKWEHERIRIGEGQVKWGAEEGKKYFILEIRKIIKNETDLQQVQTT